MLYLALGETGVDPEVRLASAFAPLLLFPTVFLWKMVTVPASIHAEQRREESQERMGQVFYLSQIYVNEENPPDGELILYNLALPPEEWMNQRLEQLGFLWRVRVTRQRRGSRGHDLGTRCGTGRDTDRPRPS